MISKKIKFTLTTIVLVIIALTISIFLPGPLQESKSVLISRGSTYNIAKTLKENGVIRSKILFWLAAKASNISNRAKMKAGEYLLEPRSSIIKIISKMQRGDVLIRKITIPEGYTTSQVINLINKEGNLIGPIYKVYKEGDFLPETYFYTYGDSKESILDKMQKSMQTTLNNLWDMRDKSSAYLNNKNEALILASIVEKEAKTDDDRYKIASTLLNRLAKGIKLEADPTTIYAITLGKYYLNRPLTKNDLSIKSPYNTYFAKGLPPTPISNPGTKALRAVLNPIKTDYLYFVVADCQGNHIFAKVFVEHIKNVSAYRKLKCS